MTIGRLLGVFLDMSRLENAQQVADLFQDFRCHA